MMKSVALVNMPFCTLHFPSIALAQLKYRLAERFGEQIHLQEHYLNIPFAHYLEGVQNYEIFEQNGLLTGFGDWFFRQAAFPDAADNTDTYFETYSFGDQAENNRLKQLVREKRAGLEAYWKAVIVEQELHKVDLIGLTSFFSQTTANIAMARWIKELNPDVCIVVGGPNCDGKEAGATLIDHVPWFDFIFSGSGLKSFPDFVARFLEDNPERLHNINGVYSKQNRLGNAVQAVKSMDHIIQGQGTPLPTAATDNPQFATGEIGDELPITVPIELDYSVFLDTFEQHLGDSELEPVLFFETSRGCWWGETAHCTFCGVNGLTMQYRNMEPDHAVGQFQSLFDAYGDRCNRFDGVDNIMPHAYPKTVFNQLQTPDDITIFYEIKANLKEAEVKALSDAGVKVVQPGIESISTSSLKLMKKGATAFVNLKFLVYCLLHDVYPDWNILIGFPREHWTVYEKLHADMPLLHHLPAPGDVFPIMFDRFAPYFIEAEEYGLDLHPYDYYLLTYPFPKESVYAYAYYFLDHNTEADYASFTREWMPALHERLKTWIDRWEAKDGLEPARLYHYEEAGEHRIYDSRDGYPKTFSITADQKAALTHLEQQRRIERLEEWWVESGRTGFDELLVFFREKGLVFEEGERLMSLVLRHFTQPLTFKAKYERNPEALTTTMALPHQVVLERV